MTVRDRIRTELQMITGIYSDDLEYMCAVMLGMDKRTNNPVDSKPEIIKSENIVKIDVVQDLESWFNSLEGGQVDR